MGDYDSILNFINKTKYNIENEIYNTGNELKEDFYKANIYSENLFNTNMNADFSNLCAVHRFLIDEVYKIHKQEINDTNEQIFMKNLNIKKCISKLIDGKRAFNIYSFNDHTYEYFIIGDLHSDTVSLKNILKTSNFFNKIINKENFRLVFLGDYIDRGKCHLKMLSYILSLKYIFPKNIFLLKGNHDGGSFINNELKLCVKIHKTEDENDYFLSYLYNLSKINNTFNIDMIEKYLDFFNSLCNIAFINHKNTNIMSVHGGIPRPRKECAKYFSYIESISNLTDDSITDNIKRTITHNMLWSDPHNPGDDLRENSGRFRFTGEHFKEFKNILDFDIFIRGHEAEEKGYKKFFDNHLITIFSSGMILDNKNHNINNETAYENVTPKILNIQNNGEVFILDLT